MKYYVYLFRHGRTNYNVKGLFTGRKNDAHLVWRGKIDAMRVAKKLKNKKIDVAIHTSLARSKETLDFVLKYHPECKKILVDDRMIERSYGILEGTSHKDFIRKIGKRAYDLRVEGDAIENLSKRLRKRVEAFLGEEEYKAIHRGYTVAAPGGESFLDVEKRVRSFIQWLRHFVKSNKVNVAISAHGNSVRIFRKIIENKPREIAVKWFIPYDDYFQYSFNA